MMSTALDTVSVPLPTPQSSKKRKLDSQTPRESKKKKRKQADSQDATTTQSAVSMTPTKVKKESEEDRQKQRHGSDTDIPVESQGADSMEFIDAPVPENMEQETLATQPPPVDEESPVQTIENVDETLLNSSDLSCFYSKRMSFYVPIAAISLASSMSSLLSLHLAPLLLTYFPPAEGVVLSFSDPVLSAKSDTGVNLPLRAPGRHEVSQPLTNEIFSRCADEYGVCWVWLTATLLVFNPQPGDQLRGWTNVQSEGLVGLVSYNYFQSAIGGTRIPKSWNWDGPSREKGRRRIRPKKGKLRDGGTGMLGEELAASSQTNGVRDETPMEGGSGEFLDENGIKVAESQTFRVVDVEMVPGQDKDRFTLHINGSLLSQEEEAEVVAEERQRFETVQHRSRSRTPGADEDVGLPLMSGGLALSREPSILRDE